MGLGEKKAPKRKIRGLMAIRTDDDYVTVSRSSKRRLAMAKVFEPFDHAVMICWST